MILRNVTTRTVKPFLGGGMFTVFTLDCGHTTRRNGEQLSIRRLLCGTCAADIGEKTERAMTGR